MSSPWLKFYPSDWRADPALRMCSVAARGLWMEILCLMHEAIPYGSLRINGKPVTDRQIASLAGSSADEVVGLLGELEDAGVFSRDEDGVIVSRRMQRDKAKAEADKANGKQGGNPGLKGGVNPPEKGQDKAHKPEASNHNSDASHPQRANENFEFDDWYSRYPNKVGKGQAERAFKAARKIASLEELIAGLHRYIASKPEDRQWQNPATWLNGKGWLDEPAGPPIRNARWPVGPPKPQSLGEMFREDARQQGIIPHEQPTSTPDRRLGEGDGSRQDSGTGLARRFAVTGNEFGRLG